MHRALCLAALIALATLVLAGCARHAARGVAIVQPAHVSHPAAHPHSEKDSGHTIVARKPAARPRRAAADREAPAPAAPSEPAAAGSVASPDPMADLPSTTGVPACDEYLGSYIACHRAAGVYRPDDILPHYRTMREVLLRDSQDPDTRPLLAQRCTWLARTLREALHGRACNGAPATPGSTTPNS